MSEQLELPEMDYGTVTTNRDAAGMFVHYLLEAATVMAPEREWSAQDLYAVLQFALEGGEPPASFLDGRVFERRLEEALERAERYKETFSVMAVCIEAEELAGDVYASVLDGLLERLRRSDQVFLFPKKAAIILPYTGGKDLSNLIERIRQLVETVVGSDGKISIDQAAFPADLATPAAVMEWTRSRFPRK